MGWPPTTAVRGGSATPERVFELESLLRRGVPVDEVAAATGIDPWFLAEMGKIVDARLGLAERVAGGTGPGDLDRRSWRRLKRLGFSDAQLAYVFRGTASARQLQAPHGPRR